MRYCGDIVRSGVVKSDASELHRMIVHESNLVIELKPCTPGFITGK